MTQQELKISKMNESMTLHKTASLTIGELASRYGVSLRTLRFYEQMGLIKPIRIGEKRLYSAEDKVRFEMIQTGKKFGLSLRNIKQLIESHRTNTKVEPTGIFAVMDLKMIEKQIADLERQRGALEDAIVELKSSLTNEPI